MVSKGESLPAKDVLPPAMNWSRPPPDPIGSYEIVAPEFWSSNLAVQASWAACWALEPAPARSPETPDEPLLLEPHAATVERQEGGGS